MKQQRKLWLAMLSASLIVSCTCSFLTFGPSLPESRRLGDMNIHYPEGWHTVRQDELLAISPDEIVDIFDSFIQPQPAFVVLSGYQEDWVSEAFIDAADLLDEIADEIFAESLGVKETVDGRGVSWQRASATGTFDLFERSVVGWLATMIRGDEFAFVLAVAPESDWEEYEDIFDAMLERIEFN